MAEASMKMKIKEITRGQRNNPLWHQYRQYRITSLAARKLLHSTDVGRPVWWPRSAIHNFHFFKKFQIHFNFVLKNEIIKKEK